MLGGGRCDKELVLIARSKKVSKVQGTMTGCRPSRRDVTGARGRGVVSPSAFESVSLCAHDAAMLRARQGRQRLDSSETRIAMVEWSKRRRRQGSAAYNPRRAARHTRHPRHGSPPRAPVFASSHHQPPPLDPWWAMGGTTTVRDLARLPSRRNLTASCRMFAPEKLARAPLARRMTSSYTTTWGGGRGRPHANRSYLRIIYSNGCGCRGCEILGDTDG